MWLCLRGWWRVLTGSATPVQSMTRRSSIVSMDCTVGNIHTFARAVIIIDTYVHIIHIHTYVYLLITHISGTNDMGLFIDIVCIVYYSCLSCFSLKWISQCVGFE